MLSVISSSYVTVAHILILYAVHARHSVWQLFPMNWQHCHITVTGPKGSPVASSIQWCVQWLIIGSFMALTHTILAVSSLDVLLNMLNSSLNTCAGERQSRFVTVSQITVNCLIASILLEWRLNSRARDAICQMSVSILVQSRES